MSTQPAVAFSPANERARLARLVALLREGTLREPAWLLCPREPLRVALEDRVARAGGGFVRLVDWEHLARALDDALELPFAATPDETERALAVERALAARASANPDLADPLRSDPFGVALGLLRVVDTLRLHRWRALPSPAPHASDDRASRLVAAHVELLGHVLRELESQLAARASLDTIARLRRALGALRPGVALPFRRLLVEGIDRLCPLERDVLLAMRACGVAVDVAPWVDGWPHAFEGSQETSSAADVSTNLLDALDAGARACARDDGSVVAVRVQDPHDEAEHVARWIAERVARGEDPEDFAVHLSAEAGALDRMRRALARYGVAGNGVGSTPVRQSVPWQVLRASVRLGWRGVDVVDLATVLSAPGSGIWGSDRDWLCAQLRKEVPTTWPQVREVLHRATDVTAKAPPPAPEATGDEGDVAVLALDDAPAATVDAVRQKQLDEVRARVEELLAVWELEGPFARVAAGERLGALARIVKATLNRFMVPMRFSEAIEDPRTQTAWIAAAQSITAACKAAMERLERSQHALPPHAPGVFLGTTESLLGATLDAPTPARAEGVALLVEDPFPARRPRVLVVTGFHRGRFPSPVGRPLVLGPLERDHLAAQGGDLAALPTEAELGALAQRETARALALATERLVLCAPRRTAAGDEVEVSLAWRDLLARLPEGAREDRERKGIPSVRAWLRSEFGDAPRTQRARALDAIAVLGAGRTDDAVALATPLAAESRVMRDLFAARFRPEMRFDVGDLVREQLTTAVFTPRSLETMLKCRYSFLTGALLGLKPLHLARSPSITAADRARVTRAALRSLDAVAASGRAPTDDDAANALQAAIEAEIPWAERGDARLSLDDLRRTVSAFLRRYLELRAAWKLDFANDAPAKPDAKSVKLALPSARVPSVNLMPVNPRVETFYASAEGEAASSVVMDLKLGSTAPMTALRDAGFDLDAALVPRILAAQREGGDVTAFVRLSLAKPDGEVLARATTQSGANGPYETSATTTLVTIDRMRPLDQFGESALRRVGETLEALMDDDADYAPHDEARKLELEAVGARTCEYCAMRLGCRFKMAGGAA